MAENFRELTEQYHPYYEVQPYYAFFEERPAGAKAVSRKIQVGFDIDVYGITTSLEPGPLSDYELGYDALQKVVETVLPHTSDHCSIEVIPFPSTVILAAKMHLQPQAILRIRITHTRGLDQPAGVSEEQAVKETEEKLRDLGVKRR